MRRQPPMESNHHTHSASAGCSPEGGKGCNASRTRDQSNSQSIALPLSYTTGSSGWIRTNVKPTHENGAQPLSYRAFIPHPGFEPGLDGESVTS